MFNTHIGTDIEFAKQLLISGDVVAVPTETVYGLAANALDAGAVAKIFEAKNRPFFNPLIIHTHSIEEIAKYAEFDNLSLLIAQKLMPGPLTLLLKKKSVIPDIVTAGSDKVAVRIPNHPLLLSLLKSINFPLAAPSANAFGYVSPVTAEHVFQGLQNKIPYIIDGGNSAVGLESTIIEIENESIILHRSGGLAIETIEAFTTKKAIKPTQQKLPKTSGQLKSHYATATPLIQGNITELLHNYASKKIALITYSNIYKNIPEEDQFVLSRIRDLKEAAKNLFSTMRTLDEQNKYEIIIAEFFPNEGLGIAINDRLQRAQFIHKH